MINLTESLSSKRRAIQIACLFQQAFKSRPKIHAKGLKEIAQGVLYCLYGNIVGTQKGGNQGRGEPVGTMTLGLMFFPMMVVVKPSKMKGAGKKMGLPLPFWIPSPEQ